MLVNKFDENLNRCTVCKRFIPSQVSKVASCQNCEEKYESSVFLFSLYKYQSEVKRLIKIIKYENDTTTAAQISMTLSNEIVQINQNIRLGTNPFLIPIPSTKKRIRLRGFDSTYYIASRISKVLKTPIIEFDIIDKEREYEISNNPLTRFTSESRKFKIKNIENYKYIQNHNIILIDDVITTGSTAFGLANFLKKMGANKILIYTIARSIHFTKFYLKLSQKDGKRLLKSSIKQ